MLCLSVDHGESYTHVSAMLMHQFSLYFTVVIQTASVLNVFDVSTRLCKSIGDTIMTSCL